MFNFFKKNTEVKDLQENVTIGEHYIIDYRIPFFRSQNAINKTIRDMSIKPEYKLVKTEIIKHEGMLDHDILRIEIEIKENPIPIAIIVYSIIAIAGASLLWLSLDKVYKIVNTFPKEILIPIAGGVLLIYLRKWKFV